MPRPPTARTLTQGPHILTVEQTTRSVLLRTDTSLGDCNRSDTRTVQQAGLKARPITSGVELVAAAHTACVTMPLPDAMPGVAYVLSLDARTVSGSSARLCVWEDGPDRCANTTGLPTTADWAHHRINLTLDPETQAARLYLYADGEAHPLTVTQYRNLTLERLEPNIIDITPQRPTPLAPTVSWNPRHPDAFDLRIHQTRTAQLLVLDESYAPSWTLTKTSSHAHVMADGYANAWLVDTHAGRAIHTQYTPSRIASLAIVFSGIAMLAAAVLIIVRRIRRRPMPAGDLRGLALDPAYPIQPTAKDDP
jgi:arabinofuranan 3-O-arabinosyltransferase